MNIEQRFSLQKEHLEEARNQLKDQERKMQEMGAVTRRLESDLSLLHAELERVE